MPKVSVLMPVYDATAFLADAIESILSQTMADFELLIVCEYGADDQVLRIAREYAGMDSRVVFVHNERHLGLSASLNVGIRAARGEYIARMDADDLCLPHRFKIQADFLDVHPGIGLCGCEVEFIDRRGGTICNRDSFSTQPAQIKSDLLFYCCLRHPSVMFRKSLFLEHDLLYDEGYTATEDFELWNRACHTTDFVNVPEVLLRYRWYKGNATHRNNRQGISNYLQVMDRSFRRLGLLFSDENLLLLCPITCRVDPKNHRRILTAAAVFERSILEANAEKGIYDDAALRHTLDRRFYWKHHPIRLYMACLLRGLADSLCRGNPDAKLYSVTNYLEENGFRQTVLRIAAETAAMLLHR